MTTAAAPTAIAGSRPHSRSLTIAPAVATAAITSIGAGAIHAAAIGVHSEHRQAVITFTIVAIAQLGWGILALQRFGRVIAGLGIVINTAAVVGWIMAKSNGITFIDGLDESESAQFADTTAMVFAAIAVVAAVIALFWHSPQSWYGTWMFTATAVVVAVITGFAMVSAGSHNHAHGAADGHSHGADTTATGDGHSHGGSDGSGGHTAAVVPPKEYDPNKPIDLGGVPGVTPEQQARAENLIALTLARLPQWSDPAYAESQGFVSIGDGFTGTEHFINQAYFNDDHILDPDYPESLVYDTSSGKRVLASAMYMMSTGDSWDDIPDIGGKLTQWHIHNNLCFTTGGQVAGLTNAEGGCDAPLVKGPETPMIHVWIKKHPCGPFAALEGVGAGQVKPGETKLCDHAHGSTS
jgi:hypothetical protein